jgi:capsular polysaccharide transport system permease protein
MIAKLFKLDHSFSPQGEPAASAATTNRMQNPFLKRASRGKIIFALTVVLPTILAILYYGFIASNVYVSESQFVVRSPDKPTTSGLGVILKTAGFSNANDEIYSAQAYVFSRDALRAINRNEAFRTAYSRPSISFFDRFNPTGLFGSFEDLYLYYRNKVVIEHDTVSSISTLRVRAYTPQDAVKFNRELLEMAEATVNRLNVRGRQDLIRFAQTEVDEAEGKSRSAAMNLARFRNVSGVVDPERQATVQLQMISKLQDELIASRNQLMQFRAFAPANPQVPVLRTKIAGLTRDIENELNKVAGGSRSLSAAAAQYQRYQLESEVADKQLAGAISSLQDARNEARRKQAYVERIAQPNNPDSAVEPRRLRGIIATLIFGLIAYGIVSMLMAGIREHHD